MYKQIGWDIGGAHLKAALLDKNGQAEAIQQLPCALWLGLDRLEAAMLQILRGFGLAPEACRHAVTMTGELVDLFPNRHDGVAQISQSVVELLGEHVLFYGVDDALSGHNFLTLADALNHIERVASANWHASATFLSRHIQDALLIDIGSTTTDIIPIHNAQLVNNALTDAERMQQDTLVYTGVVRTPVMAVAQKLVVNDQETNVAAEYFATMADVYRLTEELAAEFDMADTADGTKKTLFASANRVARMVGYDAKDKPMEYWLQLANACREKQIEQIQQAAAKQIKRGMKIVGAGAGAFLAKVVAQRLDLTYIGLAEVLGQKLTHDCEVCLPAYAVANLAIYEGGR